MSQCPCQIVGAILTGFYSLSYKRQSNKWKHCIYHMYLNEIWNQPRKPPRAFKTTIHIYLHECANTNCRFNAPNIGNRVWLRYFIKVSHYLIQTVLLYKLKTNNFFNIHPLFIFQVHRNWYKEREEKHLYWPILNQLTVTSNRHKNI